MGNCLRQKQDDIYDDVYPEPNRTNKQLKDRITEKTIIDNPYAEVYLTPISTEEQLKDSITEKKIEDRVQKDFCYANYNAYQETKSMQNNASSPMVNIELMTNQSDSVIESNGQEVREGKEECVLFGTQLKDITQDRPSQTAEQDVHSSKAWKFDEDSLKIVEEIRKLDITPEDDQKSEEIKSLINKYAEKYFRAHSNLSAISACPIRSRQQKNIFDYKWCIVFYCTDKGRIPPGEKSFPCRIQKYAVDVREQWFYECSKNNEDLTESDGYHDHLSAGAQIEVEDGRTGTLGCFVRLDDHMGCLTCAHVCMTKNADITSFNMDWSKVDGKPQVFQPGNSGRAIGHVEEVSFSHGERFNVSVDAALIVLTDMNRLPVDGFFVKAKDEALLRAGFDPENPPQFCSGEVKTPLKCREVHKYGCQTGLTSGLLVFDGMAVRRENIPLKLTKTSRGVEMYNQLEIYPIHEAFFSNGDSGSLIFQRDCHTSDLFAVGLGIGYSNCNHGIATPMNAILKKFSLKDCLAKFPRVQDENRNGSMERAGSFEDNPSTSGITADKKYKHSYKRPLPISPAKPRQRNKSKCNKTLRIASNDDKCSADNEQNQNEMETDLGLIISGVSPPVKPCTVDESESRFLSSGFHSLSTTKGHRYQGDNQNPAEQVMSDRGSDDPIYQTSVEEESDVEEMQSVLAETKKDDMKAPAPFPLARSRSIQSHQSRLRNQADKCNSELPLQPYSQKCDSIGNQVEHGTFNLMNTNRFCTNESNAELNVGKSQKFIRYGVNNDSFMIPDDSILVITQKNGNQIKVKFDSAFFEKHSYESLEC